MKNLIKNKSHLIIMTVAGILALVSLGVAIYYWGKLPEAIPTHFGMSGEPDAWSHKSLFYVFMVPIIQLIMYVAFLFLYEKPQYSDMPTTLLLTAMPKDAREHAFALIRTMLVGTSIWMAALFTYITYAMNASALSQLAGPSPIIMIALIVGLLAWLVWYTVKVYRYTKSFIKKNTSVKRKTE